MPLKKFQRSSQDKRIAGLFGGLGESFGVDSAYLRLAFILFALVTGVVPALIGYAIGWIITQEGSVGPGGTGPGGTERTEIGPDSL